MKYVSGRVKELKVGISSHSESKTSLTVIGNANVGGSVTAASFVGGGINTTGTSEFTNLDLSGNLKVAGISTLVSGLHVTSGSVGIGTTVPTSKLHVVGDVFTTGGISTIGNGALVVEKNNPSLGGPGVYNERVLIKNNGYVGIGTANPTENVDIVSEETGVNIRAWSKGATNQANLYLRTGDSGNSRILFGDNSDADIGEIRYYHGDDAMRFYTNTSERLRITSTGEVNISGNIVGAATSNIVPFLYSNYSLFPSATTYHGAVAHAHNTGKLYYAHGGNWIELVNKETNGTVGTGTEKYDIGITSVTNLRVAGISTYDGDLDVQSSVLITGITTIGGLVDINAGAQANTLKVEDLTDNRVVIAGTGGELEDDANLTFNGTTFNVGSAITMYQATGIVSATSFFGDGSGLENTGATLSAASGTQRLVLTSLTSGTMVTAATDADLSFNATSNLLSAGNLLVSGISTASKAVFTEGGVTDYHILIDPTTPTRDGKIKYSGSRTFFIEGGTSSDNRIEIHGHQSSLNILCEGQGETELYYSGSKKLSTTGYGVTVYDTTETQKLHVTGISTFVGAVGLNSTLQANHNVILGSDSSDRVTVNADFNSTLHPSATGTYDLGHGTGFWKTLYVNNIYTTTAGIATFNGKIDVNGGSGSSNIAGGLVVDTAKVSDLTNTRVVYAGANGELQDSANLTFNGTTLNGTFSGDGTALLVTIPGISTTTTSQFTNLVVTGNTVLATAKVSDLTDNRIVIAGASGELEDTSKLTFDGSTLSIVGDATFTGNVSVAGTLTSEDKTNIDSIGIVTARTGVRINSGGLVISSGVATFTDAIDSNGGANISGGSGLVASTAKISDLTNTRVVFVGTAGELQDNSGFTFNGSTVTAPAFSGDGSALTGITAGGVGAIGGLTVKDEGVVVGTAGSVSTLDFKGITLSVIATAGAAGVATVTATTDPDPEFSTINVTGISTFNNNVLLGDSDILGLGAAGFNGGVPDLRFFHNGNSSNIINTTGNFFISQSHATDGLYIKGPLIVLRDSNNNDIIRGTASGVTINPTSGGVTLKQNGSQTKLETTTAGITVTGTCQATDFNSTSDIKLKTNIQTIEDPLAKLVQIEGVSFNWKEDNRPALGVIADQVQEILPELVTDGDPKTVNYNGLIGLLIEAVKEQQVQITELKSKLDSLS